MIRVTSAATDKRGDDIVVIMEQMMMTSNLRNSNEVGTHAYPHEWSVDKSLEIHGVNGSRENISNREIQRNQNDLLTKNILRN